MYSFAGDWLTTQAYNKIAKQIQELSDLRIPYLLIGNKMDQTENGLGKILEKENFIFISAI